jgi:hypothetical protein
MPFDSMLVSAAVVSMFAVFAGTLIWGDFQVRSRQQAQPSLVKRRSF